MMIRLISALLAFAMMITTAGASTPGLRQAIDELNYALTVEWDQKDAAVRAARLKEFNDKVAALNLSQEEMIAFVKSEAKDAKLASDIEAAFAVVAANKMNAAQAQKYMVETMKKSYNSGASWNGGSGGLLIVVALILIIAVAASSSGGSSSSGGYYYDDPYYYDYYYYDPYYYDPYYPYYY